MLGLFHGSMGLPELAIALLLTAALLACSYAPDKGKAKTKQDPRHTAHRYG